LNDHSEGWTIRYRALKALGTQNDPNGVDALIEALLNPKEGYSYRKSIVETIAKVRHPKALQTLLKMATDDVGGSVTGSWLRESALEALGERREPEVIPVLVQALQDQNASVRTQAAIALQKHIHAHPDIILKLPTEDRNRMGRLLQDQQREELQNELCK
jgi:HEAT repeat protein